MTFQIFQRLLREAYKEWLSDKASKLAASLSFYTIFALAPLLVLITGVAGLLLDSAIIQAQIIEQLKTFMSMEGSKILETMLKSATLHKVGFTTTLVGILTLLLGATGVFIELKDSLNTLWKVQPLTLKRKNLRSHFRDRFLSVLMILIAGFLLISSLAISAGIAAFSKYVGFHSYGGVLFWSFLNFMSSITLITLLFAMMFKLLPDVKLAWGDVFFGSLITSLLFSIGKAIIGFYLGRGVVGNAYGAAGSLAVLLLWIYYSSQIFFLGAEFTKVYSLRRGSLSDN